MPPKEDKSQIEELKESLYSRTSPDVRTRRKLRFTELTQNVQTDWEHPKEEVEPVVLNEKYIDHSMSFLSKLLIFSAVFCLVAVAVGAYLFFNGANLISANNIDIKISGPVSIPGGSPVDFDITVVNNNNTNLETVDLLVDFPDGTTDPANPGETLQSYRKLLGDLQSGDKVKETVKAIIFGEQNLQKQIAVSITYSVKGSTSVFTKKQTYDVLINSSPVDVTVSSFKEITSGQEFDIKIAVKSNSDQPLKNVLLKATYPFGFTFISSDMKPLSDNATWKIGDMPPSSVRNITIHGKLAGEDNDLRSFRFRVGTASADQKNIGTEYLSMQQEITIQKPFISTNITIDGDSGSGDYATKFGSANRIDIKWFNNLPSTVSHMEIVAKLSGTAYDKELVLPEDGYFDSANNAIVWNERTNSNFSSVGSGDSGRVSFSVTPKDVSVTNPKLTVSVSVSGDRTQESRVPENLGSVVSRNIALTSEVSLSGRAVRNQGPFTNVGPIPPKTETETTYTVLWTIDNTVNSVTNAKVSASLPTYVRWMNAVSPSSENVTFEQNSGVVTWNAGTVNANNSGRREVAFQIAVKPGINMAGLTPTIVETARLTATDSFTGIDLTSEQDALTTRFSTDPTYRDSDGVVVK